MTRRPERPFVQVAKRPARYTSGRNFRGRSTESEDALVGRATLAGACIAALVIGGLVVPWLGLPPHPVAVVAALFTAGCIYGHVHRRLGWHRAVIISLVQFLWVYLAGRGVYSWLS